MKFKFYGLPLLPGLGCVLFFALFAVLFYARPLLAAQATIGMAGNSGAEIARAEPAATALCYHGGEGFMIAPPPGWGNLPYTAEIYGLCVMYAPAGYSFDNAPALIYPRVTARPAAADPVQAQVESMLASFAARPDGGGVEAVRGGQLQAAAGLDFELRYFNQGPAPNNYELVAYHPAENAMLLLVLTARNSKNRQAAESDFRQMLREVFPVQVRDSSGRLP